MKKLIILIIIIAVIILGTYFFGKRAVAPTIEQSEQQNSVTETASD